LGHELLAFISVLAVMGRSEAIMVEYPQLPHTANATSS